MRTPLTHFRVKPLIIFIITYSIWGRRLRKEVCQVSTVLCSSTIATFFFWNARGDGKHQKYRDIVIFPHYSVWQLGIGFKVGTVFICSIHKCPSMIVKLGVILLTGPLQQHKSCGVFPRWTEPGDWWWRWQGIVRGILVLLSLRKSSILQQLCNLGVQHDPAL